MKKARKKTVPSFLFSATCFLILPFAFLTPVHGITLKEAVQQALTTHPAVAEAQRRLQKAEALWKSTLSPYLPSVDFTGSADQYDSGGESEYVRRSTVSMDYILFDGGFRRKDRTVAFYRQAQAREDLASVRLDVIRDVSAAFVRALSRKRILNDRAVQLQDAEKDYRIAEGRYRLGVAMKSDVLQASVRREEARFAWIRAEGELKKAVATLRSLIGRPPGGTVDPQGNLDQVPPLPDHQSVMTLAEERPDVRRERWEVAAALAQKKGTTAPFLPTVSAQADYSTTSGTGTYENTDDLRRIGLYATWNLFRLDKFYRRQAADFQVHASKARLAEILRQARLECHNRYEDVVTATKNVPTARWALREAEHNYRQALGEYKLGKGDILALVRAESGLAAARVRLTLALEELWIAWVDLQRATGREEPVPLTPHGEAP